MLVKEKKIAQFWEWNYYIVSNLDCGYWILGMRAKEVTTVKLSPTSFIFIFILWFVSLTCVFLHGWILIFTSILCQVGSFQQVTKGWSHSGLSNKKTLSLRWDGRIQSWLKISSAFPTKGDADLSSWLYPWSQNGSYNSKLHSQMTILSQELFTSVCLWLWVGLWRRLRETCFSPTV